ncbi:UNVERIFIED_CONTAM: methyltransferase family protein [Acetivibrio alkalicellulosi]
MEDGNAYSGFAYVYDQLMYDVNYIKWCNFIENIFKTHGQKPNLVLDLACGTGSFLIEMAKRGYDMIGVDLSMDMLNCAKQKSGDLKNILYLNQDIIDFELYGTVDAVVCLMDSINYITDKRNLKKLLKKVHNYLNNGGLFIFDINTPYKFKKILKDNVFYDVSDEISYIWQNYYDSTRKICQIELTIFKKENSVYTRMDETHYERCYEIDELKEIIQNSNLELIDIYDDLELCKPSQSSQRVFYVCKKP